MIGVITLLTFFFPIISILFSFVGLIFSKKNKKLYSILFSISVASLAFLYISPNTDDLYRHHLSVISYSNMSFGEMLNNLSLDIEKVPIIIEFFVCKLGNVNYLQLFTTFLTYFMITNLSIKYINKDDSLFLSSLIIITPLIFIKYLAIVSNIWFILASCFFAYGVYYDYVDKKRLKSILFIILSIFTHSSMLFSLFILLVFKLFKNKLSIKTCLFTIIFLAMINTIILLLNQYFGHLELVKLIYSYYVPYLTNKEFEESLNPTRLVIIQYIRIIPYLLFFITNRNKNNQIDNLAMLFSLFSIVLGFTTTFAMRYVNILPLIGHNLIVSSFRDKENKISIFSKMSLLVIISIWLVYQIYSFRLYKFDSLSINMFKNIALLLLSK